MKKYFFSFLGILFISAGIFLILSYSGIILSGSGGLQVTANIKSSVYLNGKYIGNTPLCKCDEENTVKKGEYDLKIIPEDKNITPFLHKIRVNKGVLTVVDRTFLPGSLASAYILSLEKIDSKDSQLLVSSIPEGALVSINDDPQGATPFLLKKIEPAEYSLEITKDGFGKKTLRIKTIPSYQLVADIVLGMKNDKEEKNNITPTPSKAQEESKLLKPTPIKETVVKIKNTPNNFLRVRQEPLISSPEITRVKPEESYPLLEEKNGWFKIKVSDGTNGWVSGDYAEKISQ